MMRAAYRNQAAVCELLIGYGANRSAMDMDSWDAASLAKFKGHSHTSDLLHGKAPPKAI
jgi:hypothetical protein